MDFLDCARSAAHRFVISGWSRLSRAPSDYDGVQLSLLTLIAVGFSLVSRCTHRAHAAF